MQTSLARRQRHRRALQAPPARAHRTRHRPVLAIVLVFLFVTGGLVAAERRGSVGVGAYNHYAEGLPDPEAALTDIQFEQQTIIYDRTGKIELARLGDLKRELVTFDEIPREIIDATTAIEDKDFWDNAGLRPGRHRLGRPRHRSRGQPRGASTITQQLVRARLLPPSGLRGLRPTSARSREIIQSIRLTQAFPGEAGKQQIITAYLNQNFYGNQSYGVEAAAKGYFGKSLDELTLAQFAILAAIPQSPTKFDLVRNAEEICLDETVADGEDCTKIKLVVPPNSEIVQRRNQILELMKTRSPLTGAKHTPAEYDAAKKEPVVLAPQVRPPWKAPHFVWQVRRELGQMLCPDTPDDCPEGRHRRLQGHRRPSTGRCSRSPRSGSTSPPAPRTPRTRRALLTSRKIPKADAGLDPGPARPQHQQRGGRRR